MVKQRTGPKPRPLADRFWEKVAKGDPDDCWLWTASTRRNGYGHFGVTRDDIELAHRVAWEIANGPIPEGLCVLHRCDVRNCVNPAHLFLGDRATNNADRVSKGRSVTGDRHWVRQHPERVPRGVAAGNARLTEQEARRILALRGTDSATRVGEAFGVSRGTVHFIWNGVTWRHLSTTS